MARLQDFQTVTPATSDNLLIVQSQGQGLSTLNVVGNKIATATTISSLDTTSKTTAGAINELNTLADNIKPKTYRVIGKIADAITGTFEGVGTAMITLSGGIARVDFTVRVTVADATDRGQWGLNSNYFASATGKTIIAQQGGVMSYYKPDGTVNYDRQGYGGCMTTVTTRSYWKPARIYKSGSNPDTYATGSWGNNLFPVDSVITGVCFGTYT